MGLLEDKIKEMDESESRDKLLDLFGNKKQIDYLIEILKSIKGDKGDKGDMPVAGKDFPIPRDGVDGKDGYTPQKGVDYFDGKDGLDADEKKIIQEVIKKIPIPRDGKDGKDGIGKDGKDGKDGSQDTPEQIKEKLKQLPVKEKWFDYNHLKNVPVDLSGKKKRLGRGTGSAVMVSNITSQIDGLTKTFTIPENLRVLTIHYSSLPFSSWIPTTDYTVSGTTLTLTASAPTPQVGQTLLVEYVEN